MTTALLDRIAHHYDMLDVPATITLKNIPDGIHSALKRTAETNHRSPERRSDSAPGTDAHSASNRACELLARARELQEKFSSATIQKIQKN